MAAEPALHHRRAAPTLALPARASAHLIALGFGSGLSPVAPGTVGTLVGLAGRSTLPRRRSATRGGPRSSSPPCWSAGGPAPSPRAHLGGGRPGAIVWDEIIAFWLVLWLVTPAGFVGAAGRVRPVPLLRRRQARAGGLGRPALQAPARRGRSAGRRASASSSTTVVAALCTLVVIAAVAVRVSDAATIDVLVARARCRAARAPAGRLATAESCTGGLIAAACTRVAGSSDWFERGFVTYSNAAKSELLGVPARPDRARMARSARRSRARWPPARWRIRRRTSRSRSPASPGPAAAAPAKPVGTVWIAAAARGAAAEATLLRGERRPRRRARALGRSRARAGAGANRSDAAGTSLTRSAGGRDPRGPHLAGAGRDQRAMGLSR